MTERSTLRNAPPQQAECETDAANNWTTQRALDMRLRWDGVVLIKGAWHPRREQNFIPRCAGEPGADGVCYCITNIGK